jgi:hypothetical protein
MRLFASLRFALNDSYLFLKEWGGWMMRVIIFLVIVFLYFTESLLGQDTIVVGSRREIRKQNKSLPPKKGDIFIVAMPTIAYNPSNGFMIGVGGSGSFFLGDPATTSISSSLVSLNLTTKQQILFTARSSVYAENNNIILNGDWRYLSTSQPTYGLGTGPMSAKLASNGFAYGDNLYSKPINDSTLMLYNQIRIHETVFKKIRDFLYAGIGYHLDIFSSIKDNLLDTISDPPVLTGYYMYNKQYGFEQDRNVLSGISFNFIFDSRDNQNNAFKGQYLNISFHVNPEFLGSSRNSTVLYTEYRKFLNLTKDHKNMLCFWGIGNFQTSGNLPSLDLPALGEDQYGKSGRGYTVGRFRGQSLIYGETEYRRHLAGIKSNPDFLSMVLFVNAVTASNKDANIGLFKYINTGFGTGLRIMVSKKARSNVGIDYGWGNYGSSGFYLKINETF